MYSLEELTNVKSGEVNCRKNNRKKVYFCNEPKLDFECYKRQKTMEKLITLDAVDYSRFFYNTSLILSFLCIKICLFLLRKSQNSWPSWVKVEIFHDESFLGCCKYLST